MIGCIGSTRPMPMKATTQAKATARRRAAGERARRSSRSCRGGGRGLREAVEGRERGVQRGAVRVVEALQPRGEAGGALGALALERLAPGGGERHEHGAGVGGVGTALREAVALEPG